MSSPTIQQRVDQTLEVLQELHYWEFECARLSELALKAKWNLEYVRDELSGSGENPGKNTDEREAWLRRQTHYQRSEVDLAETKLRVAQMELRLRHEALKTHRAILRVLGPGEL